MIVTRSKFLKLIGLFALTVFVTVAAGDIVHFKNDKKVEGTVEDGLLGMSFLENFKVSIDSKENTLILDEFNAGVN